MSESVLEGGPCYDSMPAGRELNALVAQKVMGWSPLSGGYYFGIGGKILVCMEKGDAAGPYWSPSTDIAAAWQVVAEMDRRCAHIRFHNALSSVVGSELIHQFLFGATPAPLAICRAALLVTSAPSSR